MAWGKKTGVKLKFYLYFRSSSLLELSTLHHGKHLQTMKRK